MADYEPVTGKEQKGDSSWERDVLNRLAFATLNEQRRARRWNIFFKSLLFAYLFFLLFLVYRPVELEGPRQAHTAVIDIQGLIAPGSPANADDIIGSLREAFENQHAKGIVLRINSPGGSPVQSGLIYDEIRRLREAHPEKPVYTVVTDLCASGGYYIAAASDGIYANRASVVGSIGVLMNGFGFVDAMDKLGVERRLLTAGEHKAFLDPFSPMKEDEVTYIRGILDEIHGQFITAVREGRGDRLKDEPDLFSGLVWTGEKAVELGLVDELGDTRYVAKEIVGADSIVDYTPRQEFLDLFAQRVGQTMAGMLGGMFGANGGANMR